MRSSMMDREEDCEAVIYWLQCGQSESGKTLSRGTAYNASDDPALEGVIPRSVRDIFKYIADHSELSFRVGVSFMELYNEQLFDLLSQKSRREDTIVDIREDGNKGIKIPGLTEVDISTVDETMGLLEKASEGRVTAATAMNARSSRSHAIFTLSIEARNKSDGKTLTVSKFHMVDLAGSERQKKTKAKGDRLKEGININMGLLSLGNVISALGEENRGANSHIPYRDSKLTRLLQDSLGGNSHTLMIACVSPADSNLEETISTLRYADRARKIKNKPIINKDPRNEELTRLRSQVQSLQMQLCNGGMVTSGVTESASASKELIEENEALKDENDKLTTALQSAMEENSHMSEKLMLSEQVAEKFKETLGSMTKEAEEVMDFIKKCQGLPPGVKSKLEGLMNKVNDVDADNKKSEKTLMDHDLSRFASSNPSSPDSSPSKESGGDPNCSGANFALKHSELANQLSDLNKMLVAKQELACKMGENDEKMTNMRRNYEITIKSMEDEISRLQKEKDELSQKQKAESSSNLSESRRKRIQELEEKIKGLSKQQAEQQRLLKLNKQNELKIKKYSDDITQMKQTKVKLIKQMKEESEKARQWKIAKEKEVYKLQQQEKKAQVKMSAMSLQHERRENVWKRKMEEAAATSKRLKDALAKKADVKKMKEDQKTPHGLTGSGERVRGWISSEIDVVVSVKEAEMSKEQLIKERKMMVKELNKLKQELRKTLSEDERNDVQVKRDELQSELDMRNAQISDLQQQIMGFENEKEKEKDVRSDRWTRLSSMVEAKLAVQYLFDQATEALANAGRKSQDVRDLNLQLEDIRKSNSELRDSRLLMRRHHDEEIVRMEREHEEKILFLLGQLNRDPPEDSKDVSLNKDINDVEQRLKFQAEELSKMSELHDKLMAKDEECADLKLKLQRNSGNLLPIIHEGSPASVKKKKDRRVTIKLQSYSNADEFFEDQEFSSNSDTDESSDDDDEWRKTPLIKRIRQERKSMGVRLESKRKRDSLDSEEDDQEDSINKKRSSKLQGCTCKKGCK